MIEYVKGILAEKKLNSVIVESSGIGYKIQISDVTLNALPNLGENLRLYIVESSSIYGGTSTWYGFLTCEEKELFDKIKGVSKIGSKGAMDILSKINTKVFEFKKAIFNKDLDGLCAMFGFTKKKAEKLILGLKDKLNDISLAGIDTSFDNGNICNMLETNTKDAIEALKSLGYKENVSKKLVGEILKNSDRPDEMNLEDIIKQALKCHVV
ncbi:Holliday junction branch migration protein RuvA [bacterium]